MNCKSKCWSSIGKKVINGITGLLLVGFLIAHLIGNLTLLAGPDVFNAYAHFLTHLAHGAFLIVAEIGLLAVIVFHMISAVSVRLSKYRARGSRYAVNGNAGGPSKKTFASKYMLVSGVLLLVFVVFHIIHFKFGPDYKVMVKGTEMRDLYTLVLQEFKQLPMVILYVAAMIFLALHLKHGVWSGFQSMGWSRRNGLSALYVGGMVFGILLALGFLLLPIIIYLFFDAPVETAQLLKGVSP
jgi:succinate dehydrogenase / fumarate reductase cytochrome b subunit